MRTQIVRLIGAVVCSVLVTSGTARAATNDFAVETWLDVAGDIWKLSADQFIAAHGPHGFGWVSANKKDAARAVHPDLNFADQRVWEALARFESDKLNQLSLSLYNRGDAGELSEWEFAQLITATDKSLVRWTGTPGTTFKNEDRTSSATVLHKAWTKGAYRLDLLWSYTARHKDKSETYPYRAEYIRLQITPNNASHTASLLTAPTTGAPKQVTVFELRKHVKQMPTGDVLISGVPMVDQGPKGYCAVAVAERVLRYYGRQVDQHEIAQLANTSAGGGTSPTAMFAALRRVGDKWDVEVNVHDDFRAADFEKLVRDYNRSAGAAHKTPVQIDERTLVINLMDVYQAMDPDLLKQARLKRDTSMADFKKTIPKYINAGVPLVWAVMLGTVKEPGLPQKMGGHMRLIIGFNDRNTEILYTDTWGKGHELKRLSLADAWTMTLGLYTIEPRGMKF